VLPTSKQPARQLPRRLVRRRRRSRGAPAPVGRAAATTATRVPVVRLRRVVGRREGPPVDQDRLLAKQPIGQLTSARRTGRRPSTANDSPRHRRGDDVRRGAPTQAAAARAVPHRRSTRHHAPGRPHPAARRGRPRWHRVRTPRRCPKHDRRRWRPPRRAARLRPEGVVGDDRRAVMALPVPRPRSDGLRRSGGGRPDHRSRPAHPPDPRAPRISTARAHC
jgi:hypothetical protein